MKYVNLQSVLPKSLLEELQKYIQGQVVYIPKAPGNCLEWGANTNAKKLTLQRNEQIVRGFRDGASIPELSAQYFLSEESIRKIVYKKKK